MRSARLCPRIDEGGGAEQYSRTLAIIFPLFVRVAPTVWSARPLSNCSNWGAWIARSLHPNGSNQIFLALSPDHRDLGASWGVPRQTRGCGLCQHLAVPWHAQRGLSRPPQLP